MGLERLVIVAFHPCFCIYVVEHLEGHGVALVLISHGDAWCHESCRLVAVVNGPVAEAADKERGVALEIVGHAHGVAISHRGNILRSGP